MSEKLRISFDELNSSQVQDYIDIQDQLREAVDPIDDQPWYVKLIYSSWLYLAFASMTGAFLAWALCEPVFTDNPFVDSPLSDLLGFLLLFPIVAAMSGLFLGMAEGIMCRNPQRAAFNGLISFVVGFIGSVVFMLPVNILYGIFRSIAMSLSPEGAVFPTGMGFVVQMIGRGVAWAIIAVFAGLGQGVAQWEKKVLFNGMLGGVLGGLVGGLLFDPIYLGVEYLITRFGLEGLSTTLYLEWLLGDLEVEASLSRGFGFVAIGASVGLFTGLVEGWTKTAWLMMRRGPLAGKQFIMHRDVTVLGSSPKAGIYLFKDTDIEPKHATIYNRGGRFEIEDNMTAAGTYVNGARINGRRVLQSGDQIELGKTVLEFALRSTDS